MLKNCGYAAQQCIREACTWLFASPGKNNKHRWCSMKTCGSNDDAVKYYYGKKEG